MSQVSDLPGVLDAAREAAGAGDHASAARLLRDALARQEASLGRRHPDLANTLNNLAVVCEQMGHVEEAEQFYRRAHAIAVASLRPGDPIIATSLRNLVEFCSVHGIPLWRPPARTSGEETETPAPAALAGSSEPFLPERASTVPIDDDGSVSTLSAAGALPATRRPGRVAAVVTLVAGAAAVLLLFTPFGQPGESAETPVEVQPASPAPEVATAPEPPVIAAPVVPDAPAPDTPPLDVTPVAASASTTGARPPDAATGPVTVVRAQVCSAFETRGSPDWSCTAVNDASQPGTFVFYTRLQTAADTTVEHRWYHNERLHQTMRLRVGANAGSGFRTYSRSTIGAARAGSWKVEARTADGQLLHEEHFAVR